MEKQGLERNSSGVRSLRREQGVGKGHKDWVKGRVDEVNLKGGKAGRFKKVRGEPPLNSAKSWLVIGVTRKLL
jgi:hypothetical protein